MTEPFHYSLDINQAFPEPRYISAKWEIKNLKDENISIKLSTMWKWSYLLNWKVLYELYTLHKSLNEIAKSIAKSEDDKIIEAIKNELESTTKIP